MNTKEQLAAENVDVRQYDYDDSVVLAADFGYTDSSSVEIVDDTVIAVVDGEQYDVELDGDAQASMKNGVLTIEVNA